MALNENIKTFIVHILSFSLGLKITIHSAQKA